MPSRGSRLLGRSREMAALMALLDQTVVERVDPRLIVGDAGMGKTALLDEVSRAAQRRGWRVARAAAPQGGEVSPFAVVHDLAHALPEFVEQLGEDDARLLRERPRDETVGPAGVSVALLDLLEIAEVEEPVLLLVDDLQWADVGSLAALCLAVGRLGRGRVAVVGAARPRPELDPRLHTWSRIDVGPLELGAARSLLRRALADRGSATVLDEGRAGSLAESLGRCPLALVESGRLLSDDQLSGRTPLPDPIPLAERLQEAWGRSWSCLPEPTRTAVLALAVTQGARRALTARVLADLGLTSDALDPARADWLLDAGDGTEGGARLSHPLVRDAILVAAGRSAVRAMHARAADAAEALGLPLSVVIAHVIAAAEPGDSAAVTRLLVEAERAEVAGLGDPAVQALVAAADLALDGRERSRLAARAARTLSQLSADTTHIPSILALADPRQLEPEERFWVEWLRSEWVGDEDLSHALRALETTADWARRIDSPMLPWIVYSALTDAWGLHDREAALRHARELRRLAEHPRESGRMPAWACRGMYAVTLFQIGEVAQAREQLLDVTDESRRWRPLSHDDMAERLQVAIVDVQMGQLDPWVDARLDEVASLLDADPGQTLGIVRRLQAERALRRGRLISARSLIDEAVLLGYGAGSRCYTVDRLGVSVLIAAAMGDGDLVSTEASALRASAARIGGQQSVTAADRAEGSAALAAGRLDDALAHLEPLADVPLLGRGPWDSVPLGRVDLVEALSRTGAVDRATTVASELACLLSPSTDAFAGAVRARLHGLVAHGDSARRAFDEAILAFGSAGDPFEQARTRLLLGELLRRERQIEAARHQLRLATAAFEGMGAAAWAVRAQGELRATGAPVPAPTPHPLATLTPQERRVAEAVATGATDRQAAAALFLSPRTVAYHLSSVYRKLGITSRAALAARLSSGSPESRDRETDR